VFTLKHNSKYCSAINPFSRPVVSVYKSDAPKEVSGSAAMPGVFSAPIRNDLVHFVHSNLAKNRRQGHAVWH
jgi:large subunit ribosomal protein L4e